jgi:prephenate dehydratase
MSTSGRKTIRVAFQGEPGAFSEAAAIQLLGDWITTVPCPTFDATFRSVLEGAADALLVPVENSLAGSVVRVYDLLLESDLGIVAETILPIEHHLIGCPGTSLKDIRSVASHPMALAQCEKFFLRHPGLKRVPAEDTAGSVRDVLTRGDKSAAGIAGRRAALHYGGVILAESIQDNAENFTRFVLLIPVSRESSGESVNTATAASPAVSDLMAELRVRQIEQFASGSLLKVSVALRLAHKPPCRARALCAPWHQSDENRESSDPRQSLGLPVLSRSPGRIARPAPSCSGGSAPRHRFSSHSRPLLSCQAKFSLKNEEAGVSAGLHLLNSLLRYFSACSYVISSSCTPDHPCRPPCRPSSAAGAVRAARQAGAAHATTAPSTCFP